MKQGHPARAERSGATQSTASPQLRNLGQAASPFFSWIPTIVRARGAGQSPHGEVRGDRLEREAVVCLRGSREAMCSSDEDEQLLGGLRSGEGRGAGGVCTAGPARFWLRVEDEQLAEEDVPLPVQWGL